MHRDYQCQMWFVEAVQFQEFLRTELMKSAAKAGLALPAYPVIPITDKNLRIERLQIPISEGTIRLHSSQKTLVDQLQQWPVADHDDGPDCLEMLWKHAIEMAATTLTATTIKTSAPASSGPLGGYRL